MRATMFTIMVILPRITNKRFVSFKEHLVTEQALYSVPERIKITSRAAGITGSSVVNIQVKL